MIRGILQANGRGNAYLRFKGNYMVKKLEYQTAKAGQYEQEPFLSQPAWHTLLHGLNAGGFFWKRKIKESAAPVSHIAIRPMERPLPEELEEWNNCPFGKFTSGFGTKPEES